MTGDSASLTTIGRMLAVAGRELELYDRPGAHLDARFCEVEDRWWHLVRATSTAPAHDLAGAAVQLAAAYQLVAELVDEMMPAVPAEQARLAERRRTINRLLTSALGVLERDAQAHGVDLEAIGLASWLRSAHCDPWSRARGAT